MTGRQRTDLLAADEIQPWKCNNPRRQKAVFFVVVRSVEFSYRAAVTAPRPW